MFRPTNTLLCIVILQEPGTKQTNIKSHLSKYRKQIFSCDSTVKFKQSHAGFYPQTGKGRKSFCSGYDAFTMIRSFCYSWPYHSSCVCVSETVGVEVVLKNPLKIPLNLTNLLLLWTFIPENQQESISNEVSKALITYMTMHSRLNPKGELATQL